MSSNKLSYFKTGPQKMRDYLRFSNNTRQHDYQDKWLTPGLKIPFKHHYATLAHMHDLRVWTLAYAPSTRNNLQRIQEIHRLNTEMWYYVSQAMWKRIFAGIALWFFINKIAKHRYMNNGQKDSHDTALRDVAGHM